MVMFCNFSDDESMQICSCLADILPGGTVDLCLQSGEVLSASDAFYQLIGYSQNEIGKEDFYQKLLDKKDINKVKVEIAEQVKKKGRAELQLGICGGEGKGRMWVQIYAGVMQNDVWGKFLKIAVFDVTKVREEQSEILVHEQRYRIISEQMKDCIFDWDMQTGDIYHSPAFRNHFGYTLPVKGTIAYLEKSDVVFPPDKPRMFGVFRDLKKGLPYSETEYRVKKGEEYIWCKIKATTIFDDTHRPLRGVGIITDVNDYKKTTAILEEKVTKDPLTGLLNKMAMQQQIAQYLDLASPHEEYMLVVMDLDDFKKVNDHFGHAFGDNVIKDFAKAIDEVFGANSLCGRFGGDEFMVFSKRLSLASAEELLKKFFDVIFTWHQNSMQIRCSVGAVMAKGTSSTFKMLFGKADIALYEAKRRGKNQYFLVQHEG